MALRPVIVIGAARSGTKLLRDLLAQSPDARAVPHDVNYVWRSGNERVPHDALTPGQLTPRARARIRAALPGLAGLPPDGDAVMIEKTVSNTLRVPFVDAVYPEARFVHLVRDGRAVAESALREWKAPPDWRRLLAKLRTMPLGNAPYLLWFGANQLRGRLTGRGAGGDVWGPRYPGFEADLDLPPLEFCARQWAASLRSALDGFETIDRARVFTIRYEDVASGHAELMRLVDWLGLEGRTEVEAAWHQRIRPGDAAKWRAALGPEEVARLTEALRPELTRLGYEETA